MTITQQAPSTLRQRTLPTEWGLAFVLFALYTVTAVRAHQQLQTTGYDLGIFHQVVRSYAEGRMGITDIKGPDYPQLGDHFSPILMLLAPVYRVFPSVYTLLVAQAALMAVAVVPLAGWARRALGTGAALAVGTGYGLSWGIAQAIGFDFHEIAFAVPMLAMSLSALGRRRLTAAALWALPLLLVKEDMGLTVAAIGLLIAGYGGRRLGLGVAAAGLLGMALIVTVLLPALNPDDAYAYTGMIVDGQTDPVTPGRYVKDTLLAPAKVGTVLMLVAITGFAAVRSPLILVAVPTLAWRFASDNPYYWGTGFHYSAVLMPVVFAALVDALRPAGRLIRVELTAVVVVAVLLLPQFPLFEPFRGYTWRADPRVAAAHRLLDRIPDGTTVAASNNLAPQLTGRTTVFLFAGLPANRPYPDWIAVDLTGGSGFPLSVGDRGVRVAEAERAGYRVVHREAGFLLLKRS
ncbi:DUF2079 domain-containing protein [Catenuloplanes japonicus]|uniref:DUF2079 domain-containing protein n=1 Tax=Catenuloplanes japonicus TaxID=33876 RepID=UPI00068F6D9A|nr:DUF2079 domain-containing protein [Catenuloplanes japonicus]